MLKERFSNLSVPQEGGCFLSTKLFPRAIYSAYDLCGRKLDVATGIQGAEMRPAAAQLLLTYTC